MVKLQDSSVVDPEMEKLIYKRAKAKHNVDIELEYVTPLLKVSPEDDRDGASRGDNSFERVESLTKNFKAAHSEYVEKINENTNHD